MCDHQPTSRRDLLVGAAVGGSALLLAGGAAATAAPAAPAVPAIDVMPDLAVFPREAWGADLPPKGPITREEPRFLLVHHTASPNNYRSARDVIRLTYSWHTSNDPTKGWPDVAYQFFVGRDGDVWEGRAGALAGPVMASATGGSQGWAQLVCLLGDFTSVQPTAAALDSLVKVLAWLGMRYGIDTAPGATATFVSRGSQKWKRGALVTSTTIAPHRDMSHTGCPGNAFSPRVAGLATAVQTQRARWGDVTMPAVRLGAPST